MNLIRSRVDEKGLRSGFLPRVTKPLLAYSAFPLLFSSDPRLPRATVVAVAYLLDAGRLGGGRWWRLGLQQRLNGEHDGTAHLLRKLVELQGLHSTDTT